MIYRFLILGLVIGSNNFAVALAFGALGQRRRLWRVVLVFGCFEFLIPLVGLWVGRQMSQRLESWAGVISPLLLAAVGVWILVQSFRDPASGERMAARMTHWRGLLLVATVLSLDNLIIGFSLGIRGTYPLLLAANIAAFSIVFTWIGIRVGAKARRQWETTVNRGSGMLLLLLAVMSWAGWI